MNPELIAALPYIAFIVVFGGGSIVMFVAVAIRNSKRSHEKNHRFHSELMCDHCRVRGHDSTRWPMKILGSPTPKGTG